MAVFALKNSGLNVILNGATHFLISFQPSKLIVLLINIGTSLGVSFITCITLLTSQDPSAPSGVDTQIITALGLLLLIVFLLKMRF